MSNDLTVRQVMIYMDKLRGQTNKIISVEIFTDGSGYIRNAGDRNLNSFSSLRELEAIIENKQFTFTMTMGCKDMENFRSKVIEETTTIGDFKKHVQVK